MITWLIVGWCITCWGLAIVVTTNDKRELKQRNTPDAEFLFFLFAPVILALVTSVLLLLGPLVVVVYLYNLCVHLYGKLTTFLARNTR